MTNNPIYEFFIQPILQNGWFNPVNTMVYAIVLVIAVFLVYKLLKKMHIKINLYFLLAILPFIFWGSSTRVLHDAAFAGALATPELNAFYNSPIFPTPGSYLITFLLALIVLLVSLAVQRFTTGKGFMSRKGGVPYWKLMFVIGTVLCAINIWFLPITSFFPLLLILTITVFWILLFFAVYRISGIGWFRKQRITHLFSPANQGILGVHLFDATATFTALSIYGYLEQHVVPNLVIPILGPVSMFLLKIIVVLPVLWIIDRYGEPGNFNNFLKIIIIILGLAPGLRDTIRLMAMV
jgi:uncharacterized membrane protein